MAKQSIEVKGETIVNPIKDRINEDNKITGNKIENFLKAKKAQEEIVIEVNSDDLEVVVNPTPEQLMEFQGRNREGKVILGKLNLLHGYCNKTNTACLLRVDTAKRIAEVQKKNIEQ